MKAFPKLNEKQPSYQTGMDLRDWFAGLAMQGLLANVKTSPEDILLICKASYAIASAMMQEREKNENNQQV